MPAGIFGVIISSISLATASSELDAQRQAHPLGRAEQVGRHRHVEACRALEQQPRTAAGQLAHAVGHGGNLEVGTDALANAREQTAPVEIGDEVVEVWIHRIGSG